MTALLIALGALAGAPTRYLTDRAVQARHDSVFPWGTLTVNVVASLILGLVTGASGSVDPRAVALIGTGFCGTLSTYSTFSYESMKLTAGGARFYSIANVVLSLVAGIGAASFGWTLGHAIG